MKNFAYLDKYGVLHVVAEESTAKAHGNYVSTDLECEGGYPIVYGEVTVYEDGKCYINGNERNGTVIGTPDVIQEILNQLK